MNRRRFKDLIVQRIMFILCCFVISILFFIVMGLFYKASPILAIHSLRDLLFSSTWHPSKGNFGLGLFIVSTLWVTAIAIVIAIPLSLLTAIYLTEYAPKRMREVLKPLIDLLAGISPVIYGVWGIIAIVPLISDYVMPFFSERLTFFPFLSDNYTGYSALAGGIVLSVMVFPIIISVIHEVLETVPFEIREASLALGATKWETTRRVVLKKARPGIVAAFILGLTRAFGETMAVLMVAGCSLHGFPKSVFDTAYPLPALIANTYGEMMSIPLYDSAVLLAAFILLLMTTLFNMVAWGILLHIERKER
ncbi:MAG: phosphate ABC transporter permease subunit PstC [Candidatus Fischerbacteria bacterium RBG_13_37_8]|uniref:Phosphate transport system permease protein n=1 Tax=Candidatus Fischerbacteria bacterium RBG_13_37_8 TaxID=1817863 RepID=A0A1F5V5N4_9BACT|nr:MAG: phosphate ABC transporter permease subunit PstC [Candidatus Fischerbacteria bacterium RBG_13_37_8]